MRSPRSQVATTVLFYHITRRKSSVFAVSGRFCIATGARVWELSCSLGFVPIAGDFSTNARNDNVYVWFLMLFRPTCRGGDRHFKRIFVRGVIPVGRTKADAPTTLYPSKCGHRRLAHRGSLSAGRGRPALPRRCCARQEFVVHRQNTRGRTRASAPTCSTKGKYGHRQLASGGSPSGGRGTHLPYKASPWGEAVALRLMRGCFIRYVLY